MSSDRQSLKAGHNDRREVSKERRVRDIRVPDAVNVCCADWSFRVETRGPLVDHMSLCIDVDYCELDYPIYLP